MQISSGATGQPQDHLRLFYDFHIHSALSPCADNDMTPCNIANMAALKGLQAIAVCDHNSGANLRAAAAAARRAGLLFLPGIELNTAEEVHMLAYFADADAGYAFGEEAYRALPDIACDPDYFGRQLVIDEEDNITGELPKLLLSALPWTLEECVRRVRGAGGVPVPAHINRDANSILANLGFLPPNVSFKTLETVEGMPAPGVNLADYLLLYSSDSHILGQISEPNHTIDVKKPANIKNILNILK